MHSDLDQYESSCQNFFSELTDDSFQDVPCPLCQSRFQKRIKLFEKGTMEVFRCYCDLVYNARQAKPEYLKKFYTQSKAMQEWSEIKSTYEQRRKQRSKFSRAADFVSGRCASVLDIGCGNGVFLSMVGKHVQRVGVEMNPQACQITKERGIACYQMDIDETVKEFTKRNMAFDCVTLWGVLEHIEDPVSNLKKIRDLINPGGHIIVCVPNVESLVVKLLWDQCFTFCPQHLWYFSGRTLNNALMQAGYNPYLSWTIEPETNPIMKYINGYHPYDPLPTWAEERLMKDGIGDVIAEGKGYKIVTIGALE